MVKDSIFLKINGVLVENKNILSVNFADSAGVSSDKITVGLLPNFKRPAPSDKVTLTFKSERKNKNITLNCGLFYVQTVTRTNNKNLSFTATGVEFNANQKDKISQNYKDTSLENIVKVVAKRLGHDVRFKIDDIQIESLHQTKESDIKFLERISKDYNVLFSIKNDYIYFVNKDDKTLPVTTIDVNFNSSSRIKHSTREYYKSIQASWYSTDKGKILNVTVGEGTPVFKMDDSYQNEDEATVKANAKLKSINKGIIKGSFSSRGVELYAGTKLKLVNTYQNEDDGVYSIENVNHTWRDTTGWLSTVDFEN